jgi:hypothetical protein
MRRGGLGPARRAYLTARTRAPEPRLAGADDGLGAVGHAEHGEDAGDTLADGLRLEHEAVRDVGVVQVAGHQVEDIPFASGEFGEGVDRAARHGSGEVEGARRRNLLLRR